MPFEEDENEGIYFLDHNFHEAMFAMFKKVNAKESVLGWYSSAPTIKLKPVDVEINELIRRYTPEYVPPTASSSSLRLRSPFPLLSPVFVLVDAKPKEEQLPVEAYQCVEESKDDGLSSRQVFSHVPAEIGAVEAEEVRTQSLLYTQRDVH